MDDKDVNPSLFPPEWRCTYGCPNVIRYHKTEEAWYLHLRLLHRKRWLEVVRSSAPDLWDKYNWPPIIPESDTLEKFENFRLLLDITAEEHFSRVDEWVQGSVLAPDMILGKRECNRSIHACEHE